MKSKRFFYTAQSSPIKEEENMCEKCNHESNSFMLGAMIGGIVGAALGVLFAPTDGETSRKRAKEAVKFIKEKSEPYIEEAQDKLADLEDRLGPIIEDLRENAGPLKEEITEKIENLFEDVESKINKKRGKNGRFLSGKYL